MDEWAGLASPLIFSNCKMGDSVGEDRNRIEGDGKIDSHREVRCPRGINLEGDGRRGVVSDGHRLSAVRGHHPNVVCRQDGGGSSVEVDRADSITQRHQAHTKELAQHTGAVVAFAEQHSQRSVHVDVGGAGGLRRQDLAKSDRRASGEQVGSNRVVEGSDLVGS